MESFVTFLIIITITALSGWLQKRRQGTEAEMDSESWPDASPGRPLERRREPPVLDQEQAPRELSWEEELRRLLEGKPARQEPPPPPPRAEPPPIVIVPPPERRPARPAPPIRPPAGRPAQRPVTSPLPSPHSIQPTATYTPAPLPHLQTVPGLEQRTLSRRFPSRAAQSERTRTRMQGEIGTAVNMMRERQTVRQAFIASIILSTPKGLET
jgi:hypothetical protein